MSDLPQPNVPGVASYWPGSNADTAYDDKPYKRAGGTKEQILKRYNSRIKTSSKWRSDEGFEDTWKRLIDLYRNKQFAVASPEDQIAVNIAFSTVNTIGPSVAVNHPQITVNPRHQEGEEAATSAEAAINYWWRHYNWRREIKRAVKDSLITGNGWVKVGWRYEVNNREMTPQERADSIEEQQEKASQQAEQNPEQAAALPTDDEIAEKQTYTTQDVVYDCPFVERVSPFDLYVDPEATCIEDIKWIAQRIVAPLEDVKKDERYSSAARKRLRADASTNVRWRDEKATEKTDEGTQKYNDDVHRVTLWEFYDLRAKFYCVFPDEGEDFLLEPTNFPYPYGSPFRYLPNYEVPDQFYCIGDLEAIEPLQHELNAVRSDMMNHRKRWQRAYLARRTAIGPEQQNQLLSSKDNRIVFIDEDVPLNDVVVPIPQLGIDAQMYQYSELVENDVDLVSGVSEYQRGQQSEIRRTATEAAMIQDASNARASDKLAQVEIFMADIARCVLQLAQQYLTGDHMARIVGPDGQKSWVPFDREAIQGEFDFEVEAGSTQPRDETYRRQQALQLVNVLAPYVGTAVNPQALVGYVLRDGFGIKNPEDFLMPPPDPHAAVDDKVIQTIKYENTPPDIKRQLEAKAGLHPSVMDPMTPPEMTNTDGTSTASPDNNSDPATDGGQQQQQAPGTAPTDMPQQGTALPMPGMNMPPDQVAQMTEQQGMMPSGG